MARAIERLNALQVGKLKKPGYYADGGNLWLQVAPGGSKSWVFRYTLNGRQREMGLGSLNAFTLAEARERARENRQRLADGIDPLQAKRELLLQRKEAADNVRTFDWCAAAYIKAKEAGWRNVKHGEQWRNTIATYATPVIGGLPVSAVDTARVMRVLEPIWTAKPETASRLRGRIESILGWATVQGYRSGENPGRWKGHLENLLAPRSKVAKVEHHPALPWREMGAFMAFLRAQHNTAARAVEFIILTASRTSEAFNAKWSEFDLSAATWTIPAERMKAGREHVVPLSDAALSVLETMQAEGKGSEWVFPGRNEGQALSNMAGLALLKRMKRADLTVHGFRSTFRDWAGESSNHPREVIEHALAHQLADKAEAAYQRGSLFEKRRVLMADWATYCAKPAPAGAVVPLRKTA